MEDFNHQLSIYHRKLETVLQGAMLVLVVMAILILVFAPEQNAGAPVHAKAPAIRNTETHPLNFSKIPARNSN